MRKVLPTHKRLAMLFKRVHPLKRLGEGACYVVLGWNVPNSQSQIANVVTNTKPANLYLSAWTSEAFLGYLP